MLTWDARFMVKCLSCDRDIPEGEECHYGWRSTEGGLFMTGPYCKNCREEAPSGDQPIYEIDLKPLKCPKGHEVSRFKSTAGKLELKPGLIMGGQAFLICETCGSYVAM